MIWIAAGIVLLAVFLGLGLYNGLKTPVYRLSDGRLAGPVRLCVISDLHSCRYGEGEKELIDAVDAGKPDIIAFVGDIFDDKMGDANSEALLRGLEGRYPMYFVPGNHECVSEETLVRACGLMEESGARPLIGAWETVTARGQEIELCGVGDPMGADIDCAEGKYWPKSFEEQLRAVSRAKESGRYTVLLSHRPEYFEEYARLGFDLALCGHAHGGQWRIPGLINGFYSPHQGIFPKLAGGLYRQDRTSMIVSRGLAVETTPIPRFYDRPELVFVEIGPST